MCKFPRSQQRQENKGYYNLTLLRESVPLVPPFLTDLGGPQHAEVTLRPHPDLKPTTERMSFSTDISVCWIWSLAPLLLKLIQFVKV